MIKKNLTFSERSIEMVEEIKDVKGYASFSATVHQGIAELHAKVFPAYARAPKEAKTPSEKAKEKVALREAEIQIVMEKQAKICTSLGGKVVEGDNGLQLCQYFTYNFKVKHEQQVLLDQLSTDLIKTQYHPSKARVQDLRKGLKK